MSENVVHSVHESEKTKDTNGFSVNKSGPVSQSNRSIADKNGPDGPLSGTGNSGSEAESVHRMTAAPVENTHENEADRPDGPNGPLISEGETPEESIDDAAVERLERDAIVNEGDFDNTSSPGKVERDI